MNANSKMNRIAAAAIEFLSAYGEGGAKPYRAATQSLAWRHLRSAAGVKAKKSAIRRSNKNRADRIIKYGMIYDNEAKRSLEGLRKAIIRGLMRGVAGKPIAKVA